LHDHPPPNETVAAILARRGSIDHPSWEAGGGRKSSLWTFACECRIIAT
jgi:hypothetical protein